MFRKAQAAMEFLMTYGWAIMVVLVVIGALAYFGVLNPSTFVPERCVLTLPLDCRAASMKDGPLATDDALTLAINNVGSRDITVKGLNVQSTFLTTDCTFTTSTTIPAGSTTGPTSIATTACSLKGDSVGKKGKFSVQLQYSYTDAPDVTNSMQGEVVTTIQ